MARDLKSLAEKFIDDNDLDKHVLTKTCELLVDDLFPSFYAAAKQKAKTNDETIKYLYAYVSSLIASVTMNSIAWTNAVIADHVLSSSYSTEKISQNYETFLKVIQNLTGLKEHNVWPGFIESTEYKYLEPKTPSSVLQAFLRYMNDYIVKEVLPMLGHAEVFRDMLNMK